MPESFVSGSPLRHSKNSAALNSLPAALPAPLEASVGIAHCAASPHTHNPSAEPARRDLHRISKAFGKNWRHSESFDTKKRPPSLWSVKETKTPSEALFKLFEGVPFFLSFYLIEIPPDSIRDRAHAHLATPRESDPDGESTYATHPEGARPNESPNPSCIEPNHRMEWLAHFGCDPGRRSRSRRIGGAVQLARAHQPRHC